LHKYTIICYTTYVLKNMNTQLLKLFEQYNISEQNRHEIAQIFSFLPQEKQVNLINNFEFLAVKIDKIEKEIEIEKQILIPKAIDNIRETLERVKKERIASESKWKIDFLKQDV